MKVHLILFVLSTFLLQSASAQFNFFNFGQQAHQQQRAATGASQWAAQADNSTLPSADILAFADVLALS